jgi:hypothetical protein
MQEKLIDYEGDVLPRNLAVITTKHIFEGGTIQLVVRDDEGDWQFLPYLEEISEADARIVGLGEVINLDSSILETLKMPLNHKAWRENESSIWHYISAVDDE